MRWVLGDLYRWGDVQIAPLIDGGLKPGISFGCWSTTTTCCPELRRVRVRRVPWTRASSVRALDAHPLPRHHGADQHLEIS
jgi:hypothetical protein